MSAVEHEQLVLGKLASIGGSVRVAELARQCGLSEVEVVDALCALEARGLATPASWAQGPEPMPTLPLR